jgi:hypothetical protein
MLAAFSNWSDLASNFDDALENCTSQVHLTGGADIDAMTVLLRKDFKNAALALDPNNGSTAAVPNIADPLVFEQQVSSTLVDFRSANPSGHKNARAAVLETINFIVAPTTPGGQSVTYPGFFTFRVRDNFQESPIFRHFDPMAYQLELARLSNFDITKFGYPNRSIHVSFAQDKSVDRLCGTTVTGDRDGLKRAESWEMEPRRAVFHSQLHCSELAFGLRRRARQSSSMSSTSRTRPFSPFASSAGDRSGTPVEIPPFIVLPTKPSSVVGPVSLKSFSAPNSKMAFSSCLLNLFFPSLSGSSPSTP